MGKVNKLSIFSGIGFIKGSPAKVVKYLDKMSAKGLHVDKAGFLNNKFEKDESKRYIHTYSVEGDRSFFENSGAWELIIKSGKKEYYRKKVPEGYKSVKETFFSDKNEKEMLYKYLYDGYILCGVNDGEYIFTEAEKTHFTEYSVEKSSDKILEKGELTEKLKEGWEFIDRSTDGKKNYFKRNGVSSAERKRSLKKSSNKMTAAACTSLMLAVCSLIFTFFNVWEKFVLGNGKIEPIIWGLGISLVMLVIMLVVFSRRHEYTKQLKALKEFEDNFSMAYDNLGGEKEEKEGMNSDELKEVSMFRRVTAVISICIEVLAALFGVAYSYRWFMSGGGSYIWLIIAFLAIGFAPFFLYSSISVFTDKKK